MRRNRREFFFPRKLAICIDLKLKWSRRFDLESFECSQTDSRGSNLRVRLDSRDEGGEEGRGCVRARPLAVRLARAFRLRRRDEDDTGTREESESRSLTFYQRTVLLLCVHTRGSRPFFRPRFSFEFLIALGDVARSEIKIPSSLIAPKLCKFWKRMFISER